MRRPYFYILILAGLLYSTALHAQGLPKILEASIIYGTPFKHSPDLTFEVVQPSYGMRFAHYWQTNGNQEWQVRHNYPRIGLAAMWIQIGPDETLGSAFSLAPEISLAMISSRKYEMRGTIGYGLGITTQKYDYNDNPTNNAISSPINISVQFRWDHLIRISPQWHLLASAAFTHLSNGARHLPNYGINVANAEIGVQYRSEAFDRSSWPTERIKYQRRNFAFDIQAGMGYREREESRGPAYPVFTVSGSLVYHLNTVLKMKLGFSWEKNKGAYFFGRHILLFDSVEEAEKKSQRKMLFYAQEFRFGPIGANIWIGTYIDKKNSALLPGKIFNTIEFRYYLPRWNAMAVDPYVAFDMKSHRTRAEYVSLRFGAVIGKSPK